MGFPQVDGRCQLGDGRLPGSDRDRLGRMRQPVGERVLTGRGMGSAPVLVERALAEHVQVTGIRVFRVGVPVPSRTAAGPLVAEPGQTVREIPFAAPGPVQSADDAAVPDNGGDERDGRRHEPPLAGGRQEDEQGRQHKEPGDSGVARDALAPGKVGGGGGPGGAARFVFGGGIGGGQGPPTGDSGIGPPTSYDTASNRDRGGTTGGNPEEAYDIRMPLLLLICLTLAACPACG